MTEPNEEKRTQAVPVTQTALPASPAPQPLAEGAPTTLLNTAASPAMPQQVAGAAGNGAPQPVVQFTGYVTPTGASAGMVQPSGKLVWVTPAPPPVASAASPAMPEQAAGTESGGKRKRNYRHDAIERTALIMAVVDKGYSKDCTAARVRYGGNANTYAKYKKNPETLTLYRQFLENKEELQKAQAKWSNNRQKSRKTAGRQDIV